MNYRSAQQNLEELKMRLEKLRIQQQEQATSRRNLLAEAFLDEKVLEEVEKDLLVTHSRIATIEERIETLKGDLPRLQKEHRRAEAMVRAIEKQIEALAEKQSELNETLLKALRDTLEAAEKATQPYVTATDKSLDAELLSIQQGGLGFSRPLLCPFPQQRVLESVEQIRNVCSLREVENLQIVRARELAEARKPFMRKEKADRQAAEKERLKLGSA